MRVLWVVVLMFVFLLPKLVLAQQFTEVGAAAGVADNGNNGAMAWGDYDGDGDEDFYLADWLAPDRMYRNNGNGTFTNVLSIVGMSDGNNASHDMAWADYDNDGDPDLYLNIKRSGNRLFKNNNGVFTDVAVSAGVDDYGDSVPIAWADYDNDGDVDLFVGNRSDAPDVTLRPSRLYRNESNGTFTDVSAASGVGNVSAVAGAGWADYDDDGYIDLYVVNGNEPNLLYQNQSNGTFVNVAAGAGVNDVGNGVSFEWGDYDNDGDFDIYLSDGSQANRLYQNNGNGTFNNVASAVGTADASISVDAAWGDYDNDSFLDLYVPNGFGWSNKLYQSNGNGTFTEVSSSLGVNDSGDARGASWIDYDNDGDVDMYVVNGAAGGGSVNRLYRNNGNANRWLVVKLTGTLSNSSGIGALVTAVTGTQRQLRDVSASSGHYSQSSFAAEFGFGSTATVDSLLVQWPSGEITTLTNVAVDQILNIVELTTVAASLPDTTSLYNQSISIPVRIGDTTNLDIVAAEVFVAYDGDLLTAFSAGTTGTLAANGWTVVENIVEGNGTNIDTIKVAMATDNAALAGAGALVHIDFQVADQRSPASSLLELVHVLFNDGDPDNAITNGSVVITGTDGSIDSSPATIIPREAIAVTVTDIDEDQDINSPDSFSIAVANGAQSEMLTLTETGNSTGVFTGSINTVFSFGASSGDGTVQAKAGDQIVFTYADLLDAAGATALRTVQTDAIGGADGSVAVTLVSQPGDPLYIEVTDGDLNAVISSAETVAVSVSNSRTAEVFSVVLTEVDADDAVFFGMLSTHSTASTAAEMETAEDDIITVSYDDVVTAVGDQQDRTATNDVIEPWGDADDNDALQAFDAAQVLLHVLNSGHAIDVQAANVDIDPVVTGITPFDASLILQKRVGLIASFPVQSAASTNHPQGAPASKRIAEQRSLALVMDEGYLSVVADERGGLLSGDLTLRGIVGRVEMAPELAAYLSASRPVEDGQRIVFAGAEAASGPGELLRVYTAAASRVELTSAAFNDGAIEGIGSGLNVESTPRAYALHANMPNPFNPETAIGFSLPQAGRVELVVYDALGQRVRELVSSHWSAGVHSAMWDGRSDSGAQVSSGVYFYRLRAGDFAQTRRMLLLK